MSAPRIRLVGTPLQLDLVLRPLLRIAQVAIGLIASGILLYLDLLWWAPLPLALSFVAYEAWFWWHGDRPMTLELGDVLSLVDERTDRHVVIDPDDVHAITLHHREHGERRCEVVAVLASRDDILLSIRFLVEPRHAPMDDGVDVETMDTLLGGYGGLVAATAAPEARCRQTFDDPAAQALAWMRATIPQAAWGRRAARVWRGEAPALDLFGLHEAEHDALLVFEGDTWHLTERHGETRRGTLTLVRASRAIRTVTLAGRGGDRGELMSQELPLPLLVLDLDDELALALPAPVAGMAGTERPVSPDLLHTHVPEGGALLDDLLTRWPRSAWPAALRRQAEDLLDPPDDPSPPHAARRPPHPSTP